MSEKLEQVTEVTTKISDLLSLVYSTGAKHTTSKGEKTEAPLFLLKFSEGPVGLPCTIEDNQALVRLTPETAEKLARQILQHAQPAVPGAGGSGGSIGVKLPPNFINPAQGGGSGGTGPVGVGGGFL